MVSSVTCLFQILVKKNKCHWPGLAWTQARPSLGRTESGQIYQNSSWTGAWPARPPGAWQAAGQGDSSGTDRNNESDFVNNQEVSAVACPLFVDENSNNSINAPVNDDDILFLVEKSLLKINCLLACLYVCTPLIGRNNNTKIKQMISWKPWVKLIGGEESESDVSFN